jgi:SPP1 family predicted phage head-tail adaptor
VIGAGDLRDRVAFDAPVEFKDEYGGVSQGFTAPEIALHCWAHFLYLKGGETVQASRLQGRQPVVVTIRATSRTQTITPDWRMRDLLRGGTYNIRAIVPTQDRAFLELTCETGVAV